MTTSDIIDPTPVPQIERAVVVVLPFRERLGGMTWMVAARGVGIACLALLGATLSLLLLRRTPPTWVLVAIGASMVFGAGLGLTLRTLRRRRRSRSYRDAAHSAIGDAVAERISIRDSITAKAIIDARWRELLGLDYGVSPRPLAIVDQNLAIDIHALPIRSELLEAEPINESNWGNRALLSLFLWLGLTRAIGQNRGDWFFAGLFLAMAAWMALRIPCIRDRIPLLQDTGRDLVAGPGWLRDKKGRRWRVDDSIVLVLSGRRRRKSRGVYLRFIGPAGVRDVSFEQMKNRDLALLWERWMHPSPRLELEA